MNLRKKKISIHQPESGVMKLKGSNKKARRLLYNHCGGDSVEDPPVPIPNTEVKLNCAESTLLATAREDKELPHSIYSSLAQR